MILGVVSVAAVAISNLALIDIYHGEKDVTLEWTMLRLCLPLNAAFHIFALVTLGKCARGEKGRHAGLNLERRISWNRLIHFSARE
jgi:hypothetical protein